MKRIGIGALFVFLIFSACVSAPPVAETTEAIPSSVEGPAATPSPDDPFLSSETDIEALNGVPNRPQGEAEPISCVQGGIVHRIGVDPSGPEGFGRFVELSHGAAYEFRFTEQTVEYYTVYANLGEVAEGLEVGTEVAAGAPIGTTGSGSPFIPDETSYLWLWSRDRSPYLVWETQSLPAETGAFYWYNPSAFIDPRRGPHFHYFRFEPVNFDGALDGEIAELSSNYGIETDGDPTNFVLNYHPVRGWTRLGSYPVPLDDSDAMIFQTASMIYPADLLDLFVWKTITLRGDWTVVIYWQERFNEYLRSETQPEDDLFIYADFMAATPENRRIHLFGFDFAFESLESLMDRIME